MPVGASVWAGIRPEDLKLGGRDERGDPLGKGVVRSVVNDGVVVSVALEWAGRELQTLLLAGRGLARSLSVGDPVSLAVSRERVHPIPRADDAPVPQAGQRGV